MYQTAPDSLCPAPPGQALNTGQFFLRQPEIFSPLTDHLRGSLFDFISDPFFDGFVFFHWSLPSGRAGYAAQALSLMIPPLWHTALDNACPSLFSSLLLPGLARF